MRVMVYVATEGHEWVRSPNTAKGHVDACDVDVLSPKTMWSGRMPEAILMSLDTGELTLPLGAHREWLEHGKVCPHPALPITQLSSVHFFLS